MTFSSMFKDTMFEAESRAARLIGLEECSLFDAKWYVERNPQVIENGLSAVEHYLDYGGVEGRAPGPLFDGAYYLAENDDVRASGLNPLIHFLESGAAERRNPNSMFDTGWYVDRYLANQAYALNPLEHYLEHPLNETTPITEWSRYAEFHIPHGSGETPLAHYLRVGQKVGLPSAPKPLAPQQIEDIHPSALFDADYYVRVYPDVISSELDPYSHYIKFGFKENRRPHPLIDVGYYLNQIPEAPNCELNLLRHFLDHGARTGLSPNPLFDTKWYADRYLASSLDHINPLVHFIRDGGRTTSPSPHFDAIWYRAKYQDVANAGANPLTHYLEQGMREGRVIAAVEDAPGYSGDVTEAALVVLKKAPRSGARTVLLITHAPHGRIKGHVGPMVDAYHAAGAEVVLIIAADQRHTSVPRSISDACNSVYVRANAGFDFGAWAHVLKTDETLLNDDVLILTNDSLLGPFDGGIGKIFDSIDVSSADVVGLTENVYYARHVQSFFLALKRRCLSSYGFNRYLADITNLKTKNEVIFAYELTFSSRMAAAGLRIEALFSREDLDFEAKDNNRPIFAWRSLLEEGFPFIKASLVTGEHRNIAEEEVRAELGHRGFDLRSLEPTYRTPGPKLWADLQAPPSVPAKPRISFIGPFNVANGLGVASRSYVRALHRLDCKLNLHAIHHSFHVHAKVAPDWDVRSFAGPADVVLVHLNGEGWDLLLTDEQRKLSREARFKIGLFVWETSVVPTTWTPVLDKLDAIWVPTQYCADIFRELVSVPIEVVPYVVENEVRQADVDRGVDTLRALGLDPDRRQILYAFDGSSFLARKNPSALISAFRSANLGLRGWQLVLKTKHVFDVPTEGQRLLDLIGTSGDVVVIDKPMRQQEIDLLFALCPIYASSHSSEGFGLTIAEAMELGKVVVATDYGGSRDFLDETCGFPVQAREVVLAETLGPYVRGAAWGQVNVDALARSLRQATDAVDDGSAVALGSAAQARIRETLSARVVASKMKASLDRLIAARWSVPQ